MAMRTEEWIEADCLPYYPHPLQTGGLPVGYYPQTETGAQLPASPHQTFASDPWTTFAQQQKQESFHQAANSPQSHHQHHQKHPQTLMSPSASSCGEAASPLSSPDHDTDFDGYSYAGSPLSAGVPSTYNQDQPISPCPWPSSPVEIPFRPVDERQQSAGFQQVRMCSPVSSNSSPHVAKQSFYPPNTSHPFVSPAHPPLMGIPPATMAAAPTSIPAQYMPPSPSETSEVNGPLDDDDIPAHEPYSKQIGRALLSLPGREGSVQQIYDWFEANTNRSVSGGWKNSVRHNLSLNGSFDQPDCKDAEGEGEGEANPREPGNPKKGGSWKLLVDSIAEIQSTAKYRALKNKGTTPAKQRAPANRVTKAASPPRNGGRTQSGRQGGRATSRMKQRKRSEPAAAASTSDDSAAQTQWMIITPEASSPLTPAHTPEACGPPTPVHTPEEPSLAGHSVLDAARFRIDLSGYQLGDVAGVWNGAGLFGGMHEQPQWHPGSSGER